MEEEDRSQQLEAEVWGMNVLNGKLTAYKGRRGISK